MAEAAIRYFFIERLRLATWLTAVWPRIRRTAAPGATVWYVEADAAALALARPMTAGRGLRLQPWTFDAARMYDEDGTLIWMRTHYAEMLGAFGHLARLPALASFLADGRHSADLKTWVAKQVLPGDAGAAGPGLWRAVFLILVALWQARRDGVPGAETTLFLRRWPLVDGLRSYAREQGLAAFVPVGRETRSRGVLRRVLGRDLLFLRDGLFRRAPSAVSPVDGPLLAVQYYGHFNLDRPDLYSDFFFWQQSDFPADRLLALFDLPADPLDRQRMAELARHGLHGIATRHRAARGGAPVDAAPSLGRTLAAAARVLADGARSPDAGWLDAERTAFDGQKGYWSRLFRRHGVKVFTSWFKYNGDHCAIGAALRELGGVLAVYQRSFEGDPTAKTRLRTDIYFGFAPGGAAVEAAAGSVVDLFVATGYIGDHRFPLVRPAAQLLRDALRRAGAEHIAAFFDEGSYPDRRWGIDVQRMREHYGFLLETVLQDGRAGLILKPKVPRTLRARLGPVAPLLDRALATGRCHLYDEGVLQGAVTP
ncbi:MAG: hypothetical protein JNM82_16315, partial [Rhodocyclaceae bacterium]|nr:hypothetical protein [Rhodocyclaceae bacterium]